MHALYGPLMQQALIGWVDTTLDVALETSMLWNTSCLVRLSVLYEVAPCPGGGVSSSIPAPRWPLRSPRGWEKAATLVPCACKVVLLADRGFADTALMHHLKRLGWHFRIRIKSNFWLYRPGHGCCQGRTISLVPGKRGSGMASCSPQSALGLCISPWRGRWEGTSTGR